MTRDKLLAVIEAAARTGAKELDLAGNDLTELPPEIGQLTQLETLILAKETDNRYLGNELTSLPPEIGLLRNLKALQVPGNWRFQHRAAFPNATSGNQLTALPPEIGELQNLTQLYLSSNQLTALPPEIGELQNLTQLYLSSNQLTALPPEIGELQNLTQLYLSSNQLTALPPEIGELQNLTQLDLRSNQLTALPPEIGELQNLTQLYLSSNQLTALPPEIVQLQNLTQLYLSSNQLTALPPEIGELQNLTQLDLSSNQLTALPPEIGELQNLTQLDLSSNQLTALPPEIGELQNLTQLDLSSNQLTALPPEIGELQNLTQLDLRSNQLTALPPEIVQLQNLTQLYLSSNQLTALPPEIGELQNLTQLDLSSNQLTALPPEIVQLQNLTQLDLRSNQLTALPPEIVQLQNLTQLYLSSNQLTALPPEIGELQNLTQLDLSSNQLTALPPEIVQLQNLTQLDLSSNQLTALPPEIGELQNLTQLYLSSNQLTALPPEIGELQNLTQLYLSSNQLTALPPEIVQLQNLKSLDLYRNNFSELPTVIQRLSLEQLDLSGNPLPIPPEILGKPNSWINAKDIKAIFDFNDATQNDGEEEFSLYEAKFLIVGEGGAGKTSLAKKIQNPDYELNPEEDSTHGIEVIQWCFPLEDGQEFRANLWDFGGQEIYHQTHQFFLTERALYALVAEQRKENTDFPYWLSSIELFGGDSPVLVIKNEKNNRPCTINEKQLRGEFQHIKEFFPTNLKDGRGLDAIKDAIRYHITRLDHVGKPLPKKWGRVRYALENDARNFIDQRDYFALCAGNGVTDHTEMLRISDFLHQLGICLHFQNDAVLKHLVILRPEWATNAVYAITKNADVIQDKGVFTRETAEAIWQQDYANLGDELLQLMQKFNLCYPIPGLADHYIAPQLLEFTPPDYDWDDNANLMLRYEYEFMPKGVITQLIVRLHRWIEQQQLVWRNGVVLNNGRARAEVIETYRPYKGELFIKVSGIDRKELFSVVANEVDQINDSFEKIKVAKEVPCNCEECRDSDKPHFFKLENLYGCLQRGRYEIPCFKSYQDVSVRQLTAVVTPVSFDPESDDPDFERWKWDKRSEGRQMAFDRLKQQHTEYYQPMSEPKYQIVNPQNVQIVETTAGGDAVIHKYASDPQIKSALEGVLQFLDDLQQKHPDATPDIINGEIVHVQQTQPNRWQKLRQQFRTLPRDLRNPERLKQAGKAALIQVTTDLTDNIALNAVIAALDGLSDEP
jgi:Leucine-rich repeat (LRR) protein